MLSTTIICRPTLPVASLWHPLKVCTAAMVVLFVVAGTLPAFASVRVGVTPGALADSIVAAAAEANAKGLDVQVIEFTDWTTPNIAPKAEIVRRVDEVLCLVGLEAKAETYPSRPGQSLPLLSALAAAAGAPVRLLQAGIEQIQGHAVGRMLIAVEAEGAGRDVEARLRPRAGSIRRIGYVSSDG